MYNVNCFLVCTIGWWIYKSEMSCLRVSMCASPLREKFQNFNCHEFVAVIALIENIFSSRQRDRCSGGIIRDVVRPSIFADGSGFRGLYRPEKFTVENGKRIKRARIKKERWHYFHGIFPLFFSISYSFATLSRSFILSLSLSLSLSLGR